MEADVFNFWPIFDIVYIVEPILFDLLNMGIDFTEMILDTLEDFVYESLDFSGYYLTSLT